MKDVQFLEEEIELLKRDNIQTKERLAKIEEDIKFFREKKESPMANIDNPIVTQSINTIAPRLVKDSSNFYAEPVIIENEKAEIKKEASNNGVVLIIIGSLLCLTGVGIILGIPLIIAGIYNITHSKNRIIQEEGERLDSFDENAEVSKESSLDELSVRQDVFIEKNNSSFEEEVGIKWFARIGILALVVGIGFFIKYAIDLGWINHFVRVLMGLSLGVGLVIFGEIISKKEKYAPWAKTLVGGGLAVTYFVIYGAYHFNSYREALGMSQSLDIILLIFVTLISITLSIRDNSKIIAAEAFFLGYVTALLSNDFEMMTLVYTSVLTAGLVAVVAYKKWSVIGLFGVFASYLLYILWDNNNSSFVFSSIILLFYFLSFSLQSFFISSKKELTVDNIIITLANAGFFVILAFNSVHKFYPNWDSLVVLLLALFYLASFCFYVKKEAGAFATANLYLALFFSILFVPVYFSSKLVTIIWALETALLASLYLKTNNTAIKVGFNILGILVVFRNVFLDSFKLQSLDLENFINSTRLISFFATIVSFYLIYGLFKRYEVYLSSSNRSLMAIYSWVATGLMVLIVFIEMVDKYSVWVSLILGVLTFVYIALGVSGKYKEFFYQGVGVSIILFFKLIFLDLITLREFNVENILLSERLWIFAFVIWIFYLLYIYLKNTTHLDGRGVYIAKLYSWLAFILLLLISLVEFGSDYPVGLSIFLGCLSLIYVVVSRISIRELFAQGLIATTLVAIKVLFYDAFNLKSLENSESLSEARLLPFLTMIVVGYLLGLYFSKNVEKLKESEKILAGVYANLGTIFAFFLVVSELKDYGISVGWILLALILTVFGFVFNSKNLRMQGIVILFISIFKVFIYDIRELEAIYRTISYIVLGIILLLISFIYTKYKDRIRRII